MYFLLKRICPQRVNIVTPILLFNRLRSQNKIFINRSDFHTSRSLKIITPLNAKPQINQLNINTALVKDVILYKYENPRQFRLLNIFAGIQFFFWVCMAYNSHTNLKNVPVSTDENAPWWRKINFGEAKYRKTLTYGSFLIGWLIVASAWYCTLRSVRYLILRKGGKLVSIVTYTPFGNNRIMDVPLDKISAQSDRANSRVHLPIKVQNKHLHYTLDMKGEFLNPKLFDFTVGLKRKLA